jgi:hypothetical protein
MDVAKIGSANTGFLSTINVGNILPSRTGKGIPSGSSTISDLSRTLYQSDIDLSKSTFSYDAHNTNFNIQFLRQSEQKLSLNGYYSNDLTSGKISFSYNYIQSEVKDGKTINKQFEVNFDLSFKSNRSISVEKTEKKEDILDFLRRITKEIFTKLSDKKINISAIVLDPEDLKELGQVADKKTAQLIYQLIEMIKYAVEAKMMNNKNKDAVDIIYHPERIKQEVTETTETNDMEINFSFSIKEIGVIDSAKQS